MTFFTFASPVKGKNPLFELGWDWVDGTRPVLVRNAFLWLSDLGPIGAWEKCTDHRLCGGVGFLNWLAWRGTASLPVLVLVPVPPLYGVRSTGPWMCLRLEWSLGCGEGGLVVIDGIPCICMYVCVDVDVDV
ncbi:hypothetical protein BDV35DRAFT_365307 [Aspergillus flavus]|uniref:Uncharacterized protein n=1 Tax=Aspergillus flavus TaxID=5059 RepID=A0A5N6GL39_ASPFL|nr:hypothetical protein BDV35DRAFT_365307 [Aspergillus flavus]